MSPAERRERLGQAGAVVGLSGGSDEERIDLAYALERALFDARRVAAVVGAPGSDPPDPSRTSDVASQLARAGVVAVVPNAMAPAQTFHDAVVLVHVTGRQAAPAAEAAGIPEPALSVSLVEGGPEPAALEILRTLEARKILGP